MRFEPGIDTAIARAARITPRLCPVCGSSLPRFDPVGTPGSPGAREEARCPRCNSLERNRLGWLYLVNDTDLFTDYERKAVLHMCADQIVFLKLGAVGRPALLTHEPGCPRRDALDGAPLSYASETFDVIYCSHVLEQVADDQGAMRELCRVLKPGGWAVFVSSIFRPHTVELGSDPHAPRRSDGRRRAYGPDLPDRLAEAGFGVKRDRYQERLGRERSRRYGLMPQDQTFRCTHRSAR
jgi:SAM-dependent methyltransferase